MNRREFLNDSAAVIAAVVVGGASAAESRAARSSSLRPKGANEMTPNRLTRAWDEKSVSDAVKATDQLERFLACVFLRRYATYCVRRRRYVRAHGAAGLWRELTRA